MRDHGILKGLALGTALALLAILAGNLLGHGFESRGDPARMNVYEELIRANRC